MRDEALESLVGENTEIRGEELLATSPGRPVERGSEINALPVFAVEGDRDDSVGNIDFAGDETVRGDVMPGFSINATGSVTVSGMSEHATIRAGGDLIVQGVVGLIEPEIVVGGNLTAQYLHNTSVEVAGEAVINREVVNWWLIGWSYRPKRGLSAA